MHPFTASTEGKINYQTEGGWKASCRSVLKDGLAAVVLQVLIEADAVPGLAQDA